MCAMISRQSWSYGTMDMFLAAMNINATDVDIDWTRLVSRTLERVMLSCMGPISSLVGIGYITGQFTFFAEQDKEDAASKTVIYDMKGMRFAKACSEPQKPFHCVVRKYSRSGRRRSSLANDVGCC